MSPNTYPSGSGKKLDTSNDKSTQSEPIEQPKSRLSYSIYMHRLQLCKRKRSFIEMANTKFQLTYELIKENIDNGPRSPENLAIASRETIFQTNLLREIDKYKVAQKQQMEKSYNKHYKRFQKQVQQKEEAQIMASLKTQRPKQNYTSKQPSNPQPSCNNNGKPVPEDNGTFV